MKNTPKILPAFYKSKGTPIFRDTTALPFDEGGPIYTYSKRPGSFYQRADDGSWMISNAGTKNQYVPIDDPTGQRTALLNKNAVIYNAPAQGAPKPVMNQAVWNKAQQQGEQELAAKQFVANVHKQSGTSGLYMPDGSMKPQAAQAADWVPQALVGAPVALEALGAAASIPLGGGVTTGGVLGTAGAIHGTTQIDDRYQDWQDVAAGNMDWKEAALKTGFTGLDMAGGILPFKNASNIIKSFNAPKAVKGQTLVTANAPKKVVGTIDEFGDLVDDVYTFPAGENVPINANNPTAVDLSNKAHAIDLENWNKAKQKAEANNWRFIVPEQEQAFLASKYGEEFASKYGVATDKLNSYDVALYGKMKEAEYLPKREVLPATSKLGESSKELHNNFISQNNPQFNLGTKEELVIDAYTRGYDNLINSRDPRRGANFYSDEVAPILEQTILQNKFKEPATLVRGSKDFTISENSKVLRNNESLENIKFSELQEGDLFTPNSFTSARINEFNPNLEKTPVTGFTRNPNNLDYIINAPAGQSYLYPNATPIQNYPIEMEAILPKNLQFKLDKVVSDVDRGYIQSIKDMQRGVNYGIGNNQFARVPNKFFPRIQSLDKIKSLDFDPGKMKYNQIKVPKSSYQNLIDYHNRTHTPTVPKYYFSIANPYIFGGKLNKNY